MLVSRNAFERYRGLGARQKEAGIPSTSSQLKKTQTNATKKAPSRCSQPVLAQHGSGRHNEQVVEPNAACRWRGVRSGAKKDIK